MPTYVYEVVKEDGSEGETFEIEQRMSDPTLERHPVTGEPVRRVYIAPFVASKYTPGQTKSRLEGKNVEKHGFTRYERDKLTGQYHKTAGKEGPDILKRPT